MFKLLMVLALLQVGPVAFASKGGGGGTYVLLDGEYVISDRYYQSMGEVIPTKVKQVNFEQLPEAVKRATETVRSFMTQKLGISTPDITASATYMLVPKNQQNHEMCDKYIPNLSQSTEAQVRYGCTNGSVTFLYVDVLERATLRQQAYALLHERLWTLPGATQEDVVNIVDGVMSLEEARDAQMENLEPLSSKVQVKMDALYESAKKLGLEISEFATYDRSPHGGWINKDCIDKESRNFIVGIGSQVTCIEASPRDRMIFRSFDKYRKTKLIDSTILSSVLINQGLVQDSKIINSELNGKPLFSHTFYDTTCKIFAAPEVSNALIKSSSLNGNLVSTDGAKIVGSTLSSVSTIEIGKDAELNAVEIGTKYAFPIAVVIQENAKLKNFGFYGVYVKADSEWKKSTLTVLADTRINGAYYYAQLVDPSKIWFVSQSSAFIEFGDKSRFKPNAATIDQDSEGNEFGYRRGKLYDIKKLKAPWGK